MPETTVNNLRARGTIRKRSSLVTLASINKIPDLHPPIPAYASPYACAPLRPLGIYLQPPPDSFSI